MRLEADDGRPETSPATTTRRSNGRSRSCTRTASHPGRSGPSTTSRDRPRGAGIRTKAGVIRANTARYPISARCRMPGVPRSTYYWMTGHPGTERADCVSASWCPQYGHFFQRRRRLVSNRNRAVGTRRPFSSWLSGHEGVPATVGAPPNPVSLPWRTVRSINAAAMFLSPSTRPSRRTRCSWRG